MWESETNVWATKEFCLEMLNQTRIQTNQVNVMECVRAPGQGAARCPRRYAVKDRRRKLPIPKEPTERDRLVHMLTYEPPAWWCEYGRR